MASDVDRRIINVGSGYETSINELASLVAGLVEREADFLHSPAESGGVARLCADLTAARHLLGYEPRVQLRQGLRLTLEHDRRFRRASVDGVGL